MHLSDLGWSPHFESHLETCQNGRLEPGRVAFESHETYRILSAHGLLTAELTGRLRFEAECRASLPCTGDWVAMEVFPKDAFAVIHHVLPRKTAVIRKSAGSRTEAQVLAANVDDVYIISAIPTFNPRSIERYLTLARESGAQPVLVLSKADLIPDPQDVLSRASAISAGAPAFVWSAVTGQGFAELRARLGCRDRFCPGNPGQTAAVRTAALLGPSGAGKSTLVNALAVEHGCSAAAVRTAAVRSSDGKGRHTTTSRDLIPLPGGGLLIDTPGLREAGLLVEEDSVDTGFADILSLATRCRFRDCTHSGEPGCAVQLAIAAGSLPEPRLASYSKLKREAAHAVLRETTTAAFAEKTRWKKIMTQAKNRPGKGM